MPNILIGRKNITKQTKKKYLQETKHIISSIKTKETYIVDHIMLRIQKRKKHIIQRIKKKEVSITKKDAP